ncbi:MAG: hypothetical protein ABSE96_06125 [Terracidiphilus sp.]
MLLRRVSWALLVGILLSFVPGSVAQQRYSDREALLKLNLSNQPGEIPAYYSACCRNRALEVQAALEDGLRFYREKLGIHLDLVAAVLDKNDWNRILDQRPNHIVPPYGMTYVPLDVAFIPADDDGVITQGLLAEETHETAETRRLLDSVHLGFDEAARRFIMHPILHELGHRLVIQYGIAPPMQKGSWWVDEMLASYFAYAYEKSGRPETATIVEAMTNLSSEDLKYTSLDDFPKTIPLLMAGDSSNMTWYQRQFEARLAAVYAKEGLDFLPRVKETFPAGAKNDPSPAEVLAKLELICPGFQAWAVQMANVKPGGKTGGR